MIFVVLMIVAFLAVMYFEKGIEKHRELIGVVGTVGTYIFLVLLSMWRWVDIYGGLTEGWEICFTGLYFFLVFSQ